MISQRRGFVAPEVAFVILFGVVYALYLYLSSVNVVWLTWFDQLYLLDKIEAGRLGFFGLFTKYGEHGLFGYNLLFLVNVWLFKLNTNFDVVLNFFLVLCFGLAAAAIASHDWTDRQAWKPARTLVAMAIALALMTCSQQSSGAMETQVRLGVTVPFMAITWLWFALSKKCPSRKIAAVSCLVIPVVFLVFGTLYSFAWGIGALILFLAIGVSSVERRGLLLFMSLIVVGSMLAYLQVYDVWGLVEKGGVGSGWRDSIGAFVKSVEAIWAFSGSGVAGRTLYEDGYIRQGWFFIGVGLVVFGAYVIALAYVFKTKRFIDCFVPSVMILYSIGVAAMVVIGRSNSWSWLTNYWYAVHAKVGVAGALLIAGKYLSEMSTPSRERQPYISGAIIGYTGFCLILLTVSSFADLKRAPYVRAWYEAMRPTLLWPEEIKVDGNGQTAVKLPLDQTLTGINILRKYGLNVYASGVGGAGSTLSTANLGPGWYGLENGGAWMASSAVMAIGCGKSGEFHMKGYVPGVQLPIEMRITEEGELMRVMTVDSENFELTWKHKCEGKVRIKLQTNKTFVPKSLGLNGDERELGVYVKEFFGS